MDYQKQFEEWISKNPLKQYKNNTNINYSVLAVMLNTSQVSVKRWENGESRPRDWSKLKRLLGNNIEQKWEEWLKQKPIF